MAKAAADKATKPVMTKTAILAALADETGLAKKDVSKVLDALLVLAFKETKKNGKFKIPNLGTLKKDKRPARKGRNPATGEVINIKAKTVAKFALLKSAKDAIVG